MGRIIGIDLGTTTSEVAYIKNGKPEIIVNSLGERITPSVVGLTDDNEVIVGSLAKRQASLKPERTVMEVKRLMGTNEKVNLADRELLPEEISSMILKELKSYAEEYLGEDLVEAVITVPANFNDLQRKATKKAGELAGFKVERIINEPTAAALAYGINKLEDEEKVLVYDLGGGTFDVTVLELFNGILDVKASRGNNMVGGKDFDERIQELVIENFKKEHGIDLRENQQAMARIKSAAENAKIELSNIDSTSIELPFIAIDEDRNPLEINMSLTRSEFEVLIEDLIENTEKSVDETLEAAGYSVEDIDVVLAVGGSSRIPCVRELLNRKFNRKIKTNINPDEAIALGAAVQAGIKSDEIKSEDGLIITDACRYTLGIDVAEQTRDGNFIFGIFDPLILKDSKIPCTEKKVYQTLHDDQTSIEIAVYQGDSKFVSENTEIGKFSLEGIPHNKAGEEKIEVSFTYNLNSILEVTAKVLSTGKEINKIIDTYSVLDVNGEQENKTNLDDWKDFELAKNVETLINLCEIKMKDMNADDKSRVEDVLIKLKKAVIDNDFNLVEEYDDKLTDLLFDID